MCVHANHMPLWNRLPESRMINISTNTHHKIPQVCVSVSSKSTTSTRGPSSPLRRLAGWRCLVAARAWVRCRPAAKARATAAPAAATPRRSSQSLGASDFRALEAFVTGSGGSRTARDSGAVYGQYAHRGRAPPQRLRPKRCAEGGALVTLSTLLGGSAEGGRRRGARLKQSSPMRFRGMDPHPYCPLPSCAWTKTANPHARSLEFPGFQSRTSIKFPSLIGLCKV